MPPPNPYGKEGKTARCRFLLYHCYITQDFLHKGSVIYNNAHSTILSIAHIHISSFPFLHTHCTCMHTHTQAHTHTFKWVTILIISYLFGCFPLNDHYEICMFMVSTTMNSIEGPNVVNKFIIPMSSLKKIMIYWYCSKKIDPSIPLESELFYI